MAFKPANLVKLQPSTLFTDVATIPAVQPSTPVVQFWLYNSGGDSLATVDTDDYFRYFGHTRTVDTLLYNNGQLFNVGDIIWAVCNDDNTWIQITAITPVITTSVNIADPASVNTAAIQDGAVTAAKLAADAVTNVKVAAGAAIAFAKLATLASGNILVGSAGAVPTSVAMSGDATIIASGALTIASNAITTAKILNANVTLAKLAAGITPSHIIKAAGRPTTVGGAAGENFVVAGSLTTDEVFAQMRDNGTNNVTIIQAVISVNGTMTITFSADPGNDAIFSYQVIRAAA